MLKDTTARHPFFPLQTKAKETTASSKGIFLHCSNRTAPFPKAIAAARSKLQHGRKMGRCAVADPPSNLFSGDGALERECQMSTTHLSMWLTVVMKSSKDTSKTCDWAQRGFGTKSWEEFEPPVLQKEEQKVQMFDHLVSSKVLAHAPTGSGSSSCSSHAVMFER
jgi:hypothetical protein